MSEVKEALNRASTIGNKWLVLLLEEHKPIIKRGGDQREPTTDISCACKKNGYVVGELAIPYYLHLFDVLQEWNR